MDRLSRRTLPSTTYKKQSLKIIWSVFILLTILLAKSIDTERTNQFIDITSKIINYDLDLNDKRILKMKEAITSFSISPPVEEYSIPMQGTLYKKYNESKTGIDIVAYKEFVKAIGGGEVLTVDKKNTGIDVVVKHGDIEALYGNMEKVNVKNGERILKGHIIGSMGDVSKKNKYFHFEVFNEGNRQNPLDYIKINDQTPLSYE